MIPWTRINFWVQVWLYLSGEAPDSPNVVQVCKECPLGIVTAIICSSWVLTLTLILILLAVN